CRPDRRRQSPLVRHPVIIAPSAFSGRRSSASAYGETRLPRGARGIRTAGPPVKRGGVFRDHPDRPPPLLLPENQARGTEGSNPLPSGGEALSPVSSVAAGAKARRLPGV